MRHIAVFDIGKTNAKLLAVDLATGAETSVAKRPNAVLADGPYPHYDIDGLWRFVIDGLRRLAARQAVDAISITTHGAAAVLLDGAGGLALPALDYEHAGPDDLAAEYDALRPGFSETGSPRLPMGLNLGAQIFWQARCFPEGFARTKAILTWPQYWSFRLSGVMASEPTSLGCHTDLWNPWAADFSGLVDRMGWRRLLPPVRPAATVLGPVLPAVVAATGLPAGTPVISGIHDSNASLVPWLGKDGPRAVLSTGTWMIVMGLGGGQVALDGARDLLVNVNARGEPVPTARYMAGREFDEITGGHVVTPDEAALEAVLRRGVMAMPSLHPGTGPFPGLRFGWLGEAKDDGERAAAASFYAALMGAECLGLIGAAGPVIVEGPFGGNAAFVRMLATATGRGVIAAGQGAGTGLGAALLAGPLAIARPDPAPELPDRGRPWSDYAAAWRTAVAKRWADRS
ncbi:MAG: FGGY-family carbohydrate kinase [Rhodobacter sp.]|nr:FGGY-family carbohydrate kinase [Rhodobacter sp.]